jgi:hypothetical protein
MMGSIVNGRFSGEWNNRGVASGSFDLARVFSRSTQIKRT